MAAMAALEEEAGKASAEALARLALEDEDTSVRQRAEEEVANLDDRPREIALAVLHHQLGHPSRWIRAYALLTRLANLGIVARDSRHSLYERLRLTFAAHRAAVRDRDLTWSREDRRDFYRKAAFWSVGFALLSAILVSFLVAAKMSSASPWSVVVLFAVALIFSPIVARTACGASQPSDRYLHRVPGWLAEILASAMGALPALALIVALLLAAWIAVSDVDWWTATLAGPGLLLYGGLIVASIRTATASSSVLLRRSWWSTLVGAIIGWGAGLAATTSILCLLKWALDPAPESHLDKVVDLAAVFWLLTLPWTAAVAAALARLERDNAPPTRLRYRPILVMSSFLGGLLTIACWTAYFWPREPMLIPAAARESEPYQLPGPGILDQVPARLPFGVKFRQKVWAFTERRDAPSLDLRVCQEGRPAGLGASGSLIEVVLDPGIYELEIVEASDVEGADRGLHCFRPNLLHELFDVARRLARLEELFGDADQSVDPRFYRLGARPAKSYRVDVKLNSDPDFAITGKIPDLLLAGEIDRAFADFEDIEKRHQLKRSEKVRLLDLLCRVTSLRSLIGDLAPEDSGKLLETCDQAVELSGKNAVVRDSRGLAYLATGNVERAKPDLQEFARWTADSLEGDQRQRWLEVLDADDVSGSVVSQPDSESLLRASRSRSVGDLTRELAERRVREGANLLAAEIQSLLADDAAEASSDDAFEQAFSRFELAAEMIPALRSDSQFWRFLCRRGALLGPENTQAAIGTCQALPLTERDWLSELRQLLDSTPERLREWRRKALEEPSPKVPELDFDALRTPPSTETRP